MQLDLSEIRLDINPQLILILCCRCFLDSAQVFLVPDIKPFTESDRIRRKIQAGADIIGYCGQLLNNFPLCFAVYAFLDLLSVVILADSIDPFPESIFPLPDGSFTITALCQDQSLLSFY